MDRGAEAVNSGTTASLRRQLDDELVGPEVDLPVTLGTRPQLFLDGRTVADLQRSVATPVVGDGHDHARLRGAVEACLALLLNVNKI